MKARTGFVLETARVSAISLPRPTRLPRERPPIGKVRTVQSPVAAVWKDRRCTSPGTGRTIDDTAPGPGRGPCRLRPRRPVAHAVLNGHDLEEARQAEGVLAVSDGGGPRGRRGRAFPWEADLLDLPDGGTGAERAPSNSAQGQAAVRR